MLTSLMMFSNRRDRYKKGRRRVTYPLPLYLIRCITDILLVFSVAECLKCGEDKHQVERVCLQLWDWMYNFAQQFGYLGVFLSSLIGAVTIIFPLPYTLVIYVMGGLLNPFFIAVAGGLGSAIGELSGYILGYYGRAMVSKERQRKMGYMMKIFDHYGPLAIFLFALTPLPDDLLFIPLGIMRYKFVKAFIPCFLGKLLMSYILAYSGQRSIEFIRNLLGEGGWIGVILTAIFLMVIVAAMLKIDWEKVFEKYIGEGTRKG